ncbi:hypothetical protein ACFL1N_08115 [Thermodesulfobacteriota bacterium]
MSRKTIAACFAISLIFTALINISYANASGNGCDRECLGGYITKYIDALQAQKPESLPVSSNVKFTEDCKEMKLGEGLWKSKISLTDYRRDILDPREKTAISFLVLEEKGTPVFFVVRLKIENKKITEIESTVVRGREEGMLFEPNNLKTISKGMAYVPKKEERNSREEMIKMAVTYPEGLKVGSFVKVDSPMAPNAYRFENGQLMAGPNCTFFQGCDNMKTQMIPTLAGIRYKVQAVDEEMGVVAIRMNFGPGSTFQGNDVLDVWHSFKIYNNEIHSCEAYCEKVPAGTNFGWE